MSANSEPTSLIFDPFSPEFHNNPYPTYDWLREHDPIHWSFMQAWVITSYRDVEALLKASQLQIDDLPMRLRQKSQYLKQWDFECLARTIENWLFFMEPPHHTKLKGLVAKAFTPNAIELLRPAITQSVEHLLTLAEEKARQNGGEIDVMTDFAAPLPAMTVTQILGIPISDHDKLMRWSYDLFFVFDQPMSFNIRVCTFDRWNSHDMMQQLKQYGINTETLSVAKKHYDDMAMVVLEERLNGPHIPLLVDELLELRIMRDKVDHPRKGSKDLADAVCGSIYNAISLTRAAFGDIEVHDYSSVKKQYRESLVVDSPNLIRAPSPMPRDLSDALSGMEIL